MRISITFSRLLIFLFVLFLTGCPPTPPSDVVTPTDTPTPSSEVIPVPEVESALMHCVGFEELALGATYTVGDTFSDSGVSITATDFQWSNGDWTSAGFAEVENGGLAGGSGQEMEVNNITLNFDFGGPIPGLTLRFGEYGGNLNIEINGEFNNFERFEDIDGAVIGGVTVSVTNGGGNDQGTLTLTGMIDSFAIGGQELWIDDVCPETVTRTGSCVEFSRYPADTRLGQRFSLNGFGFTGLGAMEPLVNEITTGVHGLQFDHAGIQIDLSEQASSVTLTAGSYTPEPLEITALDSAGTIVDQLTVPGDNSVHTVILAGQGIISIVIRGGGNEGVLVEFCINTEPEPPVGQCVDFSDQVEGDLVDPDFERGDFVLSAAQPQLIYRTNTPGELGLQIAQEGVTMSLPQPTSRVVLRIVSYHSEPLGLIAYDAAGNTADQVTAPVAPQDTIHAVELQGTRIVSVVIEGGGNEGVLVEICIDF